MLFQPNQTIFFELELKLQIWHQKQTTAYLDQNFGTETNGRYSLCTKFNRKCLRFD